MKRKFVKYLLLIGVALAALAVALPSVAAYEGHMVDVKAQVTLDEATISEYSIGFTRSQGYWSTHVDAASYVLTINPGDSIDLGWPAPITNMNDLMGIFWANNAQNFDNSPRSELCKSKVKCAAQALAAALTAAAPNGNDLPVSLSDIQATLSRTDDGAKDAIDDLHDLLNTFNNSNETGTLGLPGGIENNADSTTAQAMANIPFADCQ